MARVERVLMVQQGSEDQSDLINNATGGNFQHSEKITQHILKIVQMVQKIHFNYFTKLSTKL